jgi:hypothetical protein
LFIELTTEVTKRFRFSDNDILGPSDSYGFEVFGSCDGS